jgi:succinate dehydrogenase / fumarate reductase flavoprotein subunit
MYHQFKQLADIDITETAMEVGPTTHYVMGGVRVEADSQMATTVPGLFAAGECAAGLHGANRLGGNSLSDLLVFGERAGRYAAEFAQKARRGPVGGDAVQAAARRALEPFERGDAEEGPYKVQQHLQKVMQDLVGIVRREEEMQQALRELETLQQRAARCGVTGNREYNPGWHTALDLRNLLDVSEMVTRAALLRKESRGAQFRDDFPTKDEKHWGKHNIVIRRAAGGAMELRQEPVAPLTAAHRQIIEENK